MRAKDFIIEKDGGDDGSVRKGMDAWMNDLGDKMAATFGGKRQMQKPTGGDRLRKAVGLGKDAKIEPAKKVTAQDVAPKPVPVKVPKIGDIKPGSAYNDGKAVWEFDGTKWNSGTQSISTQDGYKNFLKANKSGKAFVA